MLDDDCARWKEDAAFFALGDIEAEAASSSLLPIFTVPRPVDLKLPPSLPPSTAWWGPLHRFLLPQASLSEPSTDFPSTPQRPKANQLLPSRPCQSGRSLTAGVSG